MSEQCTKKLLINQSKSTTGNPLLARNQDRPIDDCLRRAKVTLRPSQSFTFDKQRPTVTLIRRKSAVERLAETKGDYVKSKLVRESKQQSPLDNLIDPNHKQSPPPPPPLPTTTTTNVKSSCSNSSSSEKSNYYYTNNELSKLLRPVSRTSTFSSKSSLDSNVERCLQRRRTLSSSRMNDDECKSSIETQLKQLLINNQSELNLIESNQFTNEFNRKWDITGACLIKSTTVKSLTIPTVTGTGSVPKIIDTGQLMTGNSTTQKNEVDGRLLKATPVQWTPIVKKKQLALAISTPTSSSQKNVRPSNVSIETLGTPMNTGVTVSRSKSDIGQRVPKPNRPKNKDEIERFFDTIGLDSTTWASITTATTTSQRSSLTTTHQFTTSESMTDTICRIIRKSTQSSSSDTSSDLSSRVSSSSSSIFEFDHRRTNECNQLKNNLLDLKLNPLLSRETSIVERNARVIKWLCNCRAVMEATT